MDRKNTLLTAVLSLTMSAFAAQAAPGPIYSVKDVGFLPGDTAMRGVSINFGGDIVGRAYPVYQTTTEAAPGYYGDGSTQHGFLYHRGKLTDLGAGVIPIKINNSGQILENTPAGTVLYEHRSKRSTPLPNGGTDLNNAGQVLLDDTGNGGYVSIRQANGKVVTYPVQGDHGYFFYPWAINDLAQVVGREFLDNTLPNEDGAFTNPVLLVQFGGSYQTIATNGESEYCFPRAINMLGQAVGYDVNLVYNNELAADLYDGGDAALFENGQNVLLGNVFPPVPYGDYPPASDATGINNLGVIVGYCYRYGDYIPNYLAFVYLNGTMYDLNTLVNATGNGLTITQAWGINDLRPNLG